MPWGRFVVRHRWPVGLVALAILAVFFIPVLNFSTGTGRADALSSSGSARAGLDQLTGSGIGAAVLLPYDVAVVGGDPDATVRALADVEGVLGAVAPANDQWRRGDTRS